MTSRRMFLGGLAAATSSFAQPHRNNVLFITIDDLRPQLGCYGDKLVKSPNIDRLASKGVVFEKAYVQQALCGPSRTSFLTGLRPDTTGIYDIETHFRTRKPDAITLPQLFRLNGYQSRGFYKVFHMAGFDANLGNLNDPPSWSEPHFIPKRSVYGPEGEAELQRSYERLRAEGKTPSYNSIPRSFAFEAPDIADQDLSDGEMALEVVKAIRQYKNRPFFIAAGFYKPHLPFVAPKRYWDLYRPSDIPLPGNQFTPHGSPEWVVPSLNELRSYVGIPKEGSLPEGLQRQLVHAYLASISYIDAQVGLLLDELDRQGLSSNTTVVLLGDHGYQMGEHGAWATKHSNFETSARAPLIVAKPGARGAGKKCASLLEFVDIYPTLAELAGLKPPKDLDGKSFARLLDDPSLPHKSGAYSQYPRGPRMGRSVTDGRFRYTEWRQKDGSLELAELFDHSSDPGENSNVSQDDRFLLHRKRLAQLLSQHPGWNAWGNP